MQKVSQFGFVRKSGPKRVSDKAMAKPAQLELSLNSAVKWRDRSSSTSGSSADTSASFGATQYSKRSAYPILAVREDGPSRADLRLIADQLRRELKAKNQALDASEAARVKAVRALQSRGAFVANMSHELRTPLNAILGFSEMFTHEIFGPLGHDRYREYAEIIHKSGSHLLNLINDVLDIAKLDAGKLEMHFERLELSKVIVECVQVIEPLASKARVEIRVNLDGERKYLEADDKRLRQILLNLLSNAVKFTRPGGQVRVSATQQVDHIALSVSDTGIGISKGDLSKVLEPFAQVDSELGRKHIGTGLGLPLVKKLAELHRGTLMIESSAGVGTTVTIALPCATSPTG